jgi:thiol-disulfide isomerase/thioredoxin
MGGFQGNGDSGATAGLCAASVKRGQMLSPLIGGDVAALVPSQKPVLLSQLAFTGADGQPKTLAAWKGRTVLLNLWATWCPPCKAEMPALDRLQAQRGSEKFEVVTVNVDTGAVEKRKKFLAEIGVKALTDNVDPSMQIVKALQTVGLSRGMPTTVLVDRDGCELATMNGPAEWDKADALKVIDAAIALPGGGT